MLEAAIKYDNKKLNKTFLAKMLDKMASVWYIVYSHSRNGGRKECHVWEKN